MTEQEIREIIRDELSNFIQSDRYNFFRKIQIQDGRNIQLGRTTGTQIGEAANQKVSLHGATPTIQSSKINDPANVSATYVQAEVQAIVNAVNAIIDVLEAKGASASS